MERQARDKNSNFKSFKIKGSTSAKGFILAMLGILMLLGLTGMAMAAGSISVDKATVQPGEAVTATFSMPYMEQSGGWVGIFKKDAADGSYITYKKLNYDSTSLQLSDPTFTVNMTEPGAYEFRMFSDYFGTKKVATAGFTVVFSPSSTISVNPPILYDGEKITASYKISKADGTDTAGWIAFCKTGQPEGEYITYKKTGGVDGKFEVVAPRVGLVGAETTYEFRLYKDYYGVWKLATSETISVIKGEEGHGEDCKARFNTLTGQVLVSRNPDIWEGKPATIHTILRVGDHVVTGPDSGCIIQLEDMSTFVMGPNAEVVLQKPPGQPSKLMMVAGDVWMNTKKIIKDGKMEIPMSQAVAGIKGTTFILEEKPGKSVLKVLEGTVEFKARSTGEVVLVKAGEVAAATEKGLIKPTKININNETAVWSKRADVTPPNAPTVNPVKASSTTITGKGEKGIKVLVEKQGKIIAQGVIDSKGAFTIKLPRQTSGQVLYVFLRDKTNNESKRIKVVVK